MKSIIFFLLVLVVTTCHGQTPPIEGEVCIERSGTYNYEVVAGSNRTNAINYAWWVNGSTESIIPFNNQPYRVRIKFSEFYITGSVCVGITYSQAPFYQQLCKDVTVCIATPVKLKAFDAEPYEGWVRIAWQSDLEENLLRYQVERSADQGHWNVISTITPKGTGHTYSLTDKLMAGTAYYRLKMIDRDGAISYSLIRVVKTGGPLKVEVYDMSGVRVLTTTTQDRAAIRSKLPRPGSYVLKISEGGYVRTGRIVK